LPGLPHLVFPSPPNLTFEPVTVAQQINYSHPSMLSFFTLSFPKKSQLAREEEDKPLFRGFIILLTLVGFLGGHLICSMLEFRGGQDGSKGRGGRMKG